MITYPIRSAIDSGIFEEVMVSTDDLEIKAIAEKAGAIVPFLRSARNSDDNASTMDVLREVVEVYKERAREFKYVCCIYPCSPLLTPSKLIEANNLMLLDATEAVIPVLRYGHPIQRALKIQCTGGLEMLLRQNANTKSQDLDAFYHDSGQFYFMKTMIILESNSIWECKAVPLVLSELEAQDIDNEDDWALAELKYLRLKERYE